MRIKARCYQYYNSKYGGLSSIQFFENRFILYSKIGFFVYGDTSKKHIKEINKIFHTYGDLLKTVNTRDHRRDKRHDKEIIDTWVKASKHVEIEINAYVSKNPDFIKINPPPQTEENYNIRFMTIGGYLTEKAFDSI